MVLVGCSSAAMRQIGGGDGEERRPSSITCPGHSRALAWEATAWASLIRRQKRCPEEAKRSWNHSSHGPGFLGEIMASQLGGRKDLRGMGMGIGRG